MRTSRLKLWSLMITLITCLFYAVSQQAVYALSEQEKAMWGASENALTMFRVPSPHGVDVMGKAQGLISEWTSIDKGMNPMKIQTVTDNLIQTYTPTEIGSVGFTVTRSVTGDGDEISVTTLYYTGNIFSMRKDATDALKRARLLSYLLQQYATTLPPPQPPATTPTPLDTNSGNALPSLPNDLELYMKLIRSQLAAENYETAMSTIEALRSAVADKQKGKPTDVPATPPSPVPLSTLPSPSANATSEAKTQDVTLYVPSKTSVVILPVVDETGAKDANDDVIIAKQSLTDQFTNRGFNVINEATILGAISKSKIDLTDEEQQKQATFYTLCKAVGADLVVFELVTDKQSKESDTWFNLVGHAKIKFWLLDGNKEQAILSAKAFDGSDGGRDARTHYGSYLATHAVRDATEHALKDFFKPYPVVSKPKN